MDEVNANRAKYYNVRRKIRYTDKRRPTAARPMEVVYHNETSPYIPNAVRFGIANLLKIEIFPLHSLGSL